MEYPIWQLTTLGGGFWVAFIATVHVFVAQFAVGGGLFLVLAERHARKKNSPVLLDFVRGHSKFFLLLTMVFGGVTGVGIWLTIALLSPQGTITLIHNFVFGWAAEWVCFLGEIVALLVYFHGWDRLTPSQHRNVGWLYFIFGWLSLFLINGIICFMLTPGQWMVTGGFWDGFFNPTMWPSLFFRTFLCIMIAGMFGFVTATRIKDEEARASMVRMCSAWTVVPFVLFALCGWWYFNALPAPQFELAAMRSARTGSFIQLMWVAGPLVVLVGLLMAIRMPRKIGFPAAFVVLAAGLFLVGSFEFTRESARKPFVIFGHTYSNSILVSQLDEINELGILNTAKWANPEITLDDPLLAGEEIFQIECSACHSIGGPMNNILPRTAKFPIQGMDSFLSGMGTVNKYMPPFAGTSEERMALAAYLTEGLHGRTGTGNPVFEEVDLPFDIPAFNAAKPEDGGDEYVLLSWNNLGMHCISDADSRFVLLPPANDLYAQLVRRADPPEVITEGVEITFAVEPGFETPDDHSEFWEYAESNFGTKLEPNIGLSGLGVSGTMKLSEHGFFEAALIPVVPYPDGGGYNPYPLFTIEARDTSTGDVLAKTRVVGPTATEMGCRNCHGGDWKEAGLAGISIETGTDILAVHDRMSGTDLKAMALDGKPQLCQSCHPDPVLGAEGQPELLNLPAALHGLHANYLRDRGSEACVMCHPNRDDGPTKCLRGRHADFLECADCHGFLEDHALSLLKKEKEAGKIGADRLMENIKPRLVSSVDEVVGRSPWLQEPDCLSCHEDYMEPDDMAYNKWTDGAEGLYRMRMDDMDAIMCAGCHNSPHAVWPAYNKYGADRDNIVPLQYQGDSGTLGTDGGCVCHTEPVEDSAHHENMVR